MNKLHSVILCLALCSCHPKESTLEELTAYITDPENGLLQSANLNGTQISVAYRPTDLWISQEIAGESIANDRINSLREKYSSSYYFIVSFERNNGEALHQVKGMEAYSQLVHIMSFDMAQYVTLTTNGQDTIPVGDFMLNRTYGLSTTTDLIFAFDKKKATNSEWVQFNINEFGLGLGNQRFRFSKKDLEGIPKLAYLTN
jgi:hypothetical protein